MLIIYSAANITDAHLVRQMLEAEGIPAFIQGEYLQGAIGELPANTEILVRVADENMAAARVIVAQWESAEPVALEEELPEDDVAGNMPQSAAGGYSLAKGVALFLAIVIGGGLAMSLLYRYAQG